MVENWLEWREKLIQLAKLESATRPMIRKLLNSLDECDELLYPEGLCSGAFLFHILQLFLYRRQRCDLLRIAD